MATTKTRMVTFRCEEDLYKELQVVAGAHNETVSELLREMTKNVVERKTA